MTSQSSSNSIEEVDNLPEAEQDEDSSFLIEEQGAGLNTEDSSQVNLEMKDSVFK